MNHSKLLLVNKNIGFTVIELIIVIMIISIMAATVVPKILSSKGFEEYAYRDELIIKLRAIQLRTMQQTDSGKCLLIQVASSSIGLLATTPNAATCEVGYSGESTTVYISDSHNINFTVSETLSSFSFSSLGKPIGCAAITPCEIMLTVVGESALSIKINKEGYIYAI